MSLNEKILVRGKLTFCMLLWGSIGLFTRYIELTAFELAFFRAFFALPVLLLFSFQKKRRRKLKLPSVCLYIASGMCIALAWSALFLGYAYTSIANAVLVYSMCPVYVMIVSPFLLKEKLDRFQIVTVIGCFIGLYALIGSDFHLGKEASKGILFALLSGVLYACIVLLNRKINLSCTIGNIDTLHATFIQLLGACLILLPYQLKNGSFSKVLHLQGSQLLCLFILGFAHTALAYHLYFSSYRKLDALEIVSFSYLEPLFSILLSVLILGELLSPLQVVGGLLILVLTYLNEYRKSSRESKKEPYQ